MSLSGNLSEKFLYKIINLIQQDSVFSELLMAIAEQTRDFLAVDRVKIYQFSEDGNGQVIAESIFNHRLPSLLGLHFPASDIPAQAREEYLAKHQSVMIDVSAQRKFLHQSYASQVPQSVNLANLSHFRYLPVDPCHIQYLLAMGVLFSLTVPIFFQDALWGLIAIHHSQPRRFSGQELENLELLSKEVTLAIAQSLLTDQVRQQSYQDAVLSQMGDLLSQSSPDIWPQILQISMESLKADGGQLYLAKELTGESSQCYRAGLQPAIAFLDSHPLWKDLIQGNYPEKLLEIEISPHQPTPNSNRENSFLAHYEIADPVLAPIRQAFTDSPIQSLLVIPIGNSQWMGCLILFRQDREYEKAWAGSINPDPRNTLARKSFEAWIEIQLRVPVWGSQELKLGQAIATHLYTALTQKFLTALIHHQAAYDSLTQLPNWIIFNQRLTLALLDTIHQAKIVGVLIISLDRFKRVNENLGHEAGNSLLKQVASRLQKTLGFYAPYNPLLSRWHGDVFILLLTNLNDTSELKEVSQNLLDSFQELFQMDNQSLYLTASIGISLAPYDGETPKSLLKCAEVALSQAKFQGKNTYQFYHAPMTTQPMDRFDLETDLRRALEQNEFLIYYQPQINLKNGQLVGLEALLRWHHPQLGLVSPIDFIPLAEETGLIIEIGRWVLKTACSDYQFWQKQQNFPLILSVNLSIRQFQHPGLTQEIFQVLEETGMNPHKLELEITESWMMQDVQGAIAILDRFNKAGIRIAIDDFGTGYSSLGKLKYLPINTLKIDKSFIDDLVNEETNLTIIECIINLSKGLNLNVIAEGIETQEQLEKLQILGCDLGQGYWISPPIPSDKIITFLLSYQSLNGQIQSFFPLINLETDQLPSSADYPITPEFPEYLALQQELKRRSRREKLLKDISQKIRLSLKLDEILHTTVLEVQQFLETDRVFLYRFNEDGSGKVVVESCAPDCRSILDEVILDPCLRDDYLELYRQGRVSMITNIQEAKIAPCHAELLALYQVKANLIVPVVYEEKLWGLMIAHHCRSPRDWHQQELELLTELSGQVAIAIHQGELFHRLKCANLKLHQLSFTDHLTQVGNRLHFDHYLAKEWKRHQRSRTKLSLILCDVDYFKQFNDAYGHLVGDSCLQTIAEVMRSVVKRPTDLIARYGGEEFALILPDTDSPGAFHLAQMICTEIRNLEIPHYQSPQGIVTLSVGLATLIPRAELDSDFLISSADQALYQAKDQGRDRVCVFPNSDA